MKDVADITLEDFAGRVGEPFALVFSDARVELELLEARAWGEPADARRDPFALVFRGPADPELVQGTYAFSHAVLGDLPLFMVPIAREEDGMRYEVTVA